MILPALLVDRVSQRDVYTVEYFNTLVNILSRQDQLAYTETVTTLEDNGIPVTDPAALGKLDPVMLTYALETVRAALIQSVHGLSFSGSIVSATPYVAVRGEHVIVDGTIGAVAVTIPDPSLEINSNAYLNIKLQGGAGPVTITPAGSGLIDGAASFSLVAAGDAVTVKNIYGLRGGAQIDTTAAAAADTVTIYGTLFTNGGAPGPGSTDWTTAAELVDAINDTLNGIADKVVAEATGDIVEVRTLYSGWEDDAALAAFTVAAVFASLDDWAALGSALGSPVALATPGQLCTTDFEGVEIKGGSYVIV